MSDEGRFWSKVGERPISGCWLWLGWKDEDGYGGFWYDGKTIKAHRFAFFIANGYWPQPFGCHTCDTPSCVRPDHVFEGTEKMNSQDMVRKGRITMHQSRKTHCPHGHSYSRANTIFEKTKLGRKRRHCRACSSRLSRAWKKRKSQEGR